MRDLNLQQQLKDYIESGKVTTTSVSRSLGISASALSLYLASKYTGDNAKIERSVKNYLEREDERLTMPDTDYIPNSISLKINGVCHIAHSHGEMAVIYGEAGQGKSWSVREYKNQNPGVLLIEVTPGFTSKYLMAEIYSALNLSGQTQLNPMLREVIKKLKDSKRLIIADESEHLPYRSLELLRRLHDLSKIGIVLVGMPALIGNLRGKHGEFAQLYSRIGLVFETSKVEASDTKEIIHTLIPSSNGLWKAFHRESNGNLRTLDKLIKTSLRISELNDKQINPEIIQQASEMLIR